MENDPTKNLMSGTKYSALPTYSERVEFPIWNLSHVGHVVALAASDDFDGTNYLDYVISGGSTGYAHIWVFDAEGSQTYRLFAKLYHDPSEHLGTAKTFRVNKPPHKAHPVQGNAVVAASAAPECCITGTQDGRVFAWLLREKAKNHNAPVTPLSLECLLGGCASTQLFEGFLAVPMSIQLLDFKRNLFGVVGHVYESSIVIVQAVIEGKEISLVIAHKLQTNQDNVMAIGHVPGHKSLIVACGTREKNRDDPDQKLNSDGSVSFIKVWKIPHHEEGPDQPNAQVMADSDLPLGEVPLELFVCPKRKKFGGFSIAQLNDALGKKDLAERLRENNLLDESGIIPQSKIDEFVAFLSGRTRSKKSLDDNGSSPTNHDEIEELLTGLSLRHYADATTGEAAKGLPLQVLQETVQRFPEQLIITCGIKHIFTTELKKIGADMDMESTYSLKMMPDHHTRKDVTFIAGDTVGKNAVTVDHHICEVWPLDDFGQGDAKGLKLRVSVNELVNPCKVTAPLWVASTARGKEGGEMDQLLCGMETGSIIIWDMMGMRGGEMIAELRSSNLFSEVLLPPFLELVTFFQLTSFAFCAWNSDAAVSVPKKAGKLFTIDLHSALSDYDISFHRATYFWAMVMCVLPFMSVIIFYVVAGGQDAALKRIRKIQSSESFSAEEAHLMEWRNRQVEVNQEAAKVSVAIENDSENPLVPRSSASKEMIHRSWQFQAAELATEARHCYCTHIRVWLTKEYLRGMSILIKVVVTIFVVPISKAAGTIFDCDYDEEKHHKYVAIAPDIRCYVGMHRYAAIATFLIAPVFFFILMPYAVCGGDVSYVQSDEILHPTLWRGNAEKKASVRYTGFLHPKKENFFFIQMVTFIQKIAFPIVVLETSFYPLLQKLLLLLISTIVLICFIYFPSMVSPRARALMQGSKMLTVWAILCGTYSILSIKEGVDIGDDENMTPTIVLVVGSLILCVGIMVEFFRRDRLKFASVAISTSSVAKPLPDELDN